MHSRILEDLSRINAADWNALLRSDYPFLRHEFLSALEQHRCLREFGWHPQHLTLYDGDRLIAALPLYIKDNSYGELVFDWAWADAYHRSGIPYYPKLVSAIPYTPASGPRLLVHPTFDYHDCAVQLLESAIELAGKIRASSFHCLFTNPQDTEFLKDQNLSLRLGCQFHWHNQGYESFDHYLESMTAAKRKSIRRERRRVQEQGIELEIRHGDEMSEELWQVFHSFYCSTFDRKSGMATLSLDFFKAIGQSMPRQVVLVFARHEGRYIASALNFRDDHTLYGRHWGCSDDYHSLHFEACYYQGLEYCIQHRLACFEPGAQGEHKISRGFLPSATWSAHWIAQPEFADAIARHVLQEQRGMQHYIDSLMQHSPFRQGQDHVEPPK